jgi:dihydropteroate synthase
LKRLRGKLGRAALGRHLQAAVAEKAFELEVAIINDPSALTFDPDLARAVGNANAGLILNHMRGTPETWLKLPPLKNVMLTIASELEASAHRAVHAGRRAAVRS